MQNSKNSSVQTLIGWLLWILLSIGSFFIAVGVWSPFLYKHFGSVQDERNAILWVIAVFGTWLVFLAPLIIVMYLKVDKAYEDARIRREKLQNTYRVLDIDKKLRLLPLPLRKKLESWPETISNGHLVHLRLRTGEKIPYAFILHRKEILGIYNRSDYPFHPEDIVDIERADEEPLPYFSASKWLRLDGIPFEED